MKRRCFCWTIGSIALLFIIVCMVQGAWAASENQSGASANCDIQAGACVQPLGGGSVTLEILPRPVKAMTDLTFIVTLQGLAPGEGPAIDLEMPGMSMGPNHVTLERTPDGVYTGRGVIVRCPSGRTLWAADVTIPGAGISVFTFNVIY